MNHRLFSVAGLLLALTVAAEAQQFFPRGRDRERIQLEPFAATGTIAGVGRGQIQIVTVTQQKWLVAVSPQAVVHVTGTAEPDFLRPGMFIRFTAALDKKGKGQEPVGELTIFTPSAEMGIGVWPEGMAVGDVGAEQPAQPPNPFGGAFGVGTPAVPPDTGRYMVAGRFVKERNGKLLVYFGSGTAEIELAENPAIKVDVADYTVAKQGDSISVTKGQMYPNQPMIIQANPNAVGQAMALEMEIQLSQPLTGPRKKPLRPETPKPDRPGRGRPQEPAEPDQPAQPDQPPGQERPLFGDPPPFR
jgi:hypothetical protein